MRFSCLILSQRKTGRAQYIFNDDFFSQNQTAELHLSRFANGIRGRSIRYKETWMTPHEFETSCGASGKKYLENIQVIFLRHKSPILAVCYVHLSLLGMYGQ